jgi:hypothetical protein
MSGGKGGSASSATQIPDWIKEPSVRNIGRAEQAQQIGYQPYYGLDVAAPNETQRAAAQMNIGTAQAFGMMPQGYENMTAFSGMPQAQTIGGVSGYSSAPMFEQAVKAGATANPTQAEIYNSLFGSDTGYKGKVV